MLQKHPNADSSPELHMLAHQYFPSLLVEHMGEAAKDWGVVTGGAAAEKNNNKKILPAGIFTKATMPRWQRQPTVLKRPSLN